MPSDHLSTPVLPHSPSPQRMAMMEADGRIKVPGITGGLSVEAYLPLLQLYAAILEARRVVERHRHYLLAPGLPAGNPQDPLTPLQASRQHPHLFYKREDLTVTSAYKVRGALVGMAKGMETLGQQAFLAVSTGNHALGVLKAAEILRPQSVRIVVPTNTARHKVTRIQQALAALPANVRGEMVSTGETFDDARAWALSQDAGEYYLDPYSDPWVVAGQGTLGLELCQQIAPLLTGQPETFEVIAPVGGGGLLTGIATALTLATAWDARFRTVDFRFRGLQLADPNAQLGDAIRVKAVAAENQSRLAALGVAFQAIDDAWMAAAVAAVAQDIGATVEGASGATALPGFYHTGTMGHRTVAILSGGNVAG